MIQAKANLYQRRQGVASRRSPDPLKLWSIVHQRRTAAKVHGVSFDDRANRQSVRVWLESLTAIVLYRFPSARTPSFATKNETRVDWQSRHGAGSKICLSFLGCRIPRTLLHRAALSGPVEIQREERKPAPKKACSARNKEGDPRSDVFRTPLFSLGREK